MHLSYTIGNKNTANTYLKYLKNKYDQLFTIY
jgi:hypothetical protein